MATNTISVLVVEDEALIAMTVEDLLHELGVNSVHLARDLKEARDLLDVADVDFAILDVNVGSALIYPFAAELRGRDVPFVFSTGRARNEIPEEWHRYQILPKPLDPNVLHRAMQSSIASWSCPQIPDETQQAKWH